MVYLPVMKEFENIELKSKIYIEDAAYHKLLLIVADNKNKLETGGIIIGYYDETCQNAVITEFTRPPKDSKAARFRFYRGIKGLKSLLQQCWKEQNEYYLGEWHLHPDSSPTPSPADVAQMKKIAKDKNFNCKEPILMILGEVAKAHVVSLAVFKNNQVFYYEDNKKI